MSLYFLQEDKFGSINSFTVSPMILDHEMQYFLFSFPTLCMEKSPDPQERRLLRVQEFAHSESETQKFLLSREEGRWARGWCLCLLCLRPRGVGEIKLKITQEERTTHPPKHSLIVCIRRTLSLAAAQAFLANVGDVTSGGWKGTVGIAQGKPLIQTSVNKLALQVYRLRAQ